MRKLELHSEAEMYCGKSNVFLQLLTFSSSFLPLCHEKATESYI